MATTPETLFIVRIELHDVDQDHEAYELLHSKMTDAGFNQEAVSDEEDTKYEMPRATYRQWLSVNDTSTSICDLGRAILNAVIAECKRRNIHSHLSGSIYAIKSAEPPIFTGLKPVKKP